MRLSYFKGEDQICLFGQFGLISYPETLDTPRWDTPGSENRCLWVFKSFSSPIIHLNKQLCVIVCPWSCWDLNTTQRSLGACVLPVECLPGLSSWGLWCDEVSARSTASRHLNRDKQSPTLIILVPIKTSSRTKWNPTLPSHCHVVRTITNRCSLRQQLAGT